MGVLVDVDDVGAPAVSGDVPVEARVSVVFVAAPMGSGVPVVFVVSPVVAGVSVVLVVAPMEAGVPVVFVAAPVESVVSRESAGVSAGAVVPVFSADVPVESFDVLPAFDALLSSLPLTVSQTLFITVCTTLSPVSFFRSVLHG